VRVNLCCGHATCQRVVAEVIAETVADAVTEARRTALRDAAEAVRAETLHGTADQWDWANWLERRAAGAGAVTAPTGESRNDDEGRD
jgi:hypothetical protein